MRREEHNGADTGEMANDACSKTRRILFLHNIPTPYRIPLFKELSRSSHYDWTVSFLGRSHKHRKWPCDNLQGFKYSFLSGITIEIGQIIVSLNPSIIKTIIRRQYDLIIVNGVSDVTSNLAMILCRMLDVPVIIYSEGTAGSQSSLGRVFQFWSSSLARCADAIIVPGKRSREFYLLQGVRSESIFIAPDAVDNAFFVSEAEKLKNLRSEMRNELGLDNSIIILFVGQLIHRKGVDILIDAYLKARERRKNLSLIIVGDGPERPRLEKKCGRSLEKDIRFMGWIDEREKNIMYSIADVFVLPTRSDIWGLVVNEAMCFCLPVIATTAAGASDDLIINGLNGYKVAADNVEDLEGAIIEITDSNSGIQSMGKASRMLVTSHNSIEAEADGFLKAVRNVVCKRNATNQKPESSSIIKAR